MNIKLLKIIIRIQNKMELINFLLLYYNIVNRIIIIKNSFIIFKAYFNFFHFKNFLY